MSKIPRTTLSFSVLALVVAGALAVAGWRHFRPPVQRDDAQFNTAQVHPPEPPEQPLAPATAPEPLDALPPLAPPPPPVPDSPRSPGPPLAAQAGTAAAAAPPPPKNVSPRKPATAAPPPRKPKPPLQDPTARVAMSFVGADPDAEAYWLEAIFDASLPDGEREDLMEDLNEEGLSDHRRPGPEDFPLIMNRLALIEEIAPNADEFMLRHLGEAYKDLVNLAHITQGGGRPVK